jgi:uncharacterized membrane protein
MNENIKFNLSTKNLVVLVLLLQIILVGLIVLAYFGIVIPLIRQILGFIFIVFVPGFLLLKVLRINNTNLIETFSYSVGISIALVIFLGLILNLISPVIGITNPISILPLIITFSSLNMGLLFFYIIRNEDGIYFEFANLYHSDKNRTLLLILLPFLSIIGTHLFNLDITNIFLLILIALIAITMVTFVIKKNSPEFYPLAILAVSLSLLLHRSLITNNLMGWDIQLEYYYSSTVLQNSFYSIHGSGTLNSLLSITLLNPIYSIILDLNEVWVYKIAYPLVYSIVPLVLYNFYNKSFNERNQKIAFVAVLLFISFYAFFTEMLALARQEIAMLFVVLIINTILNEKNYKFGFITVIFTFALVLSHYTTAYFFLFIILIFLVPYIFRKDHKVSLNFIFLLIVFSFAWYAYTSQSNSLYGIVTFMDNVVSSVSTEFFSISARDPGVGYIVGQIPDISLQRRYFAYLQYLIQIFISIGIFLMLIGNKITSFKKITSFNKNFELDESYNLFALGSFFMLIVTIVVPVVSTVNVSRIFLFSLISLAPMAIIGGIFIFKSLLNIKFDGISKDNSLKMIVIFILVPYFLLNSGFIYYSTNDSPSSVSLDKHMDYAKYSDAEISGVNWLSANRYNDSLVSGDVYGALPFLGHIKREYLFTLYENVWYKKGVNYYIYLREKNLKEDEILIPKKVQGKKTSNVYVNLSSLSLPDSNKIYDDGSSAVLKL